MKNFSYITNAILHSKRYLIVFLSLLGYINLYTMRINLSVGIVAMTDQNGTQEIIFEWDSSQRGLILSSFFYGYILTQFIGGYLATLIGGNIIFGGGVAVTAIATLLIPVIAKYTGLYGLIVIRIIQGIAGGLAFPSCHPLIANWAPKNEKSRMASISNSGTHFGAVIANLLSGMLSVKYGWPSIFYTFGTAGLIWYIVWAIVVRKSPENDRLITNYEREFIRNNLDNKSEKKMEIPWRQILTSNAVIAITVTHFSFNWGFYTLLTQLPTYIKETLKFELENTGIILALPYLLLGIIQTVAGSMADWIKINGYLSVTIIRKCYIFLAYIVQGSLLILIAFISDPNLCVILVTIAVAIGGLASSAFIVNSLDIAPKYAGIILGLSNTVATIPGIISPYLTGLIVKNYYIEEWRIVFFISASIYILGTTIYLLFGRGEVQSWAIDKDEIKNGN